MKKHDLLAKEAMMFYRDVPREHKPPGIRLIDDEHYRYEFVPGNHCTNWRLIWHTAAEWLWLDAERPLDREGYVNYVCDIYDPGDGVLSPILNEPLTPVFNPHGDLTFENTVLYKNKVVFLDPGSCRGLPCRELDEAKLMQSCDGWEIVDNGDPEPPRQILFTDRLHLALSLTHYIRLTRHEHPQHSLDFAWKRIKELKIEIKKLLH